MSPGIRNWAIAPLLLAAIAGLWLAADGRLTSDEPSYLYVAAYQEVPEIIAGDVQPSGIPGFLQGRILHLLFAKGVMTVFGAGETGVRVFASIHLAIMVLNLLLIGRILRALLPTLTLRRAALAMVAMTPIVLYSSLKTLADNEALLAALIATYGLIRVAQGASAWWSAAAVAGLAVAALTKNQMVFLPAAFWIAVCLVPIAGVERRRLMAFGALSGIASFLLTLAVLQALGIELSTYLASYKYPFANATPLLAKIVNLGTEFGLLWFMLPIALLSRRQSELKAFGLWLLIAMFPFVFFSGVEPRHVAVNLAAAAGLLALALEVIVERFDAWRRLSNARKSAVAFMGVVVLMASNAFMLAIMPHKVDLGMLRGMLQSLDQRYGAGRYVLLTSNGYTDFHLIRVLWPERDVRDVGTSAMLVNPHQGSRVEHLHAYLGDRYFTKVSELAAIGRPLIFVGFEQTFAAANLQTMLNRVSIGLGDRLIGNVDLVEHLYTPYTQWLWESPDLRLNPVAQAGHYRALEVSVAGGSDANAIKRFLNTTD